MKSRTSARRKRTVRCPRSTSGKRPARAMRRTVRASMPSMSATSSLLSSRNDSGSCRSVGDNALMSGSLPPPAADVVDSFGVVCGAICPPAPSHDLAAWLVRITPAGAPTVRLPLFEIPQVHDSVQPPPRVELLPRERGRHAPRAGIPAWSMEAAFLTDVEHRGSLELAELSEFRDYSEHDARGRSRSVGRRVKQGRELLASFGAWPWAVALPLPHRWWTQEAYLSALSRWHREAWLAAYSSLQFCTSQFVGRSRCFNSIDELERAHAAYDAEVRWAADTAARRAA